MTRHPGRWHHDRDDAAWMMRNERMMRRSHAVLVTAAVVGLSLQPLRLLPRRLSPPAVGALPRRTSLGRLPAHWESTHHSRRKSTWVWAVPDVPVSAMSPVSWVATTRATPLPSSGSTASPAQLAHDTVGPASAPRRGSPASPEPRTEEEPACRRVRRRSRVEGHAFDGDEVLLGHTSRALRGLRSGRA